MSMLIILPPSETKASGGSFPPLDFDSLRFPELTDIRRDIAADLQALSVDETLAALGLSEKLRDEAAANQQVLSSATMPAIERYTGVLYDALQAGSLDDAARARLAVGSAFFGVVGAQDLIPHYRLSGGSKLPRRDGSPHRDGSLPTMKARWGKHLTQALEQVDELVVDLRSGTYQTLGPLKDAVTVRVEHVRPDGSRKVVSHFNKHYKGLLARELALSSQDANTAEEVAHIAAEAGLEVEVGTAKKETLTMVVRD